MQPVKSSLIHSLVPPTTRGPHPTLLLLHGRGANEHDLLGLSSYLDPDLLLIAVRAPLDFPYGGYTWYDVVNVGTPDPGQFAESYARLVQFLDDVLRHYPVDPSRIALLGFSMGAVMSYALSLTKPELIHSVVAHSGYVPEDTTLRFRWDALDGKGFFVAHGSADPVIGVEFALRAKELLQSTNADLTYREYPIPHTMSEDSVQDVSSWLRTRLGLHHGR